MKKTSWFVLLAICVAACSRQAASEKQPQKQKTVASAPVRSPVTGLSSAGSPDDILVTVNGDSLTRGEADAEAGYRLAPMLNQIPPDQQENALASARREVTEQFVYKTLVRQEADRRKIEASKEEEEKALADIAARLPEGVTIEDVLKNSPIGEEQMREQVRLGIRVRKLFDEVSADAGNVTESEIDDFIAAQGDKLNMPETVRARHILIATSPEDDDATREAKKKKAEETRQKLLDGADFAQLAAECSDCPSKQRGGDLGTFSKDKMVKPFSDAAFAQKVNEIGPVVETSFGYHIIQVTEHHEAGPVPREKIAEALKAQKKDRFLREWLEGLKSKAKIEYGTSESDQEGASQPSAGVPPPPEKPEK